MLNPTPVEKLCDRQGRPYFLWDMDITLDAFRLQLVDADPDVRTHAIGKLMRQARPDDVLTLVSLEQLIKDWDQVRRYLGNRREFWTWLIPELERRAR